MVRNQKKAQKKRNFRTHFFAAFYVLPSMLFVVLILQRCRKNMEGAERIERRTEELVAKYQNGVERNNSLQKDSATVDTKRYVVKAAKEKLGLVDHGKVIFKVEH